MGKKGWTANITQMAAVGVTAAVPLVLLPGLGSPFSLPKIALLAAWAVGGTLLLMFRGLAEIRFESTVQKLVLAWLALVSASALWGETVSLEDLLIELLPPVSFLLLTWLKPNPASLASALVASGGLVGCIAVAQYLGLDPFRLIGWQPAPAGTVRMRVYATLGNPNFVAANLACVLPLIWAFDSLRLRNRLLSASAALLMLLGILVTGSRAPILGAATLALCAVFLFPSVSRRTRLVGLSLIILCVTLIAVLSAGRPVREVIEGRVFIWRVTLSQAPARTLILGDGPGAFAIKYPDWETQWAAPMPRNHPSMRFLGYQEHAHNDWLEIMVEQGIAGLLLVLLIPFGVWRLFRQAGLEFDRSAAGAASGIAVFLGLACVDFPFHRPAESFVFWTLLAIVHLVFSTVEASYAESAVSVGRAGDSCGNRPSLAGRV